MIEKNKDDLIRSINKVFDCKNELNKAIFIDNNSLYNKNWFKLNSSFKYFLFKLEIYLNNFTGAYIDDVLKTLKKAVKIGTNTGYYYNKYSKKLFDVDIYYII